MFAALFYQEYWEIVGPTIVGEVRKFFESAELDPEINHTNLCLIPKVTNPKGMSKFRPISLRNLIYKVISKMLVMRLKNILPNIVSEYQAAFILGLITDNVLIAHEVLHSLCVRP